MRVAREKKSLYQEEPSGGAKPQSEADRVEERVKETDAITYLMQLTGSPETCVPKQLRVLQGRLLYSGLESESGEGQVKTSWVGANCGMESNKF